uniref:Immunoglobulin V-set domain-containing protein n=1 Tax=Pygocentrus nattereri TaxID=42514 RepID=A0A3B4C848_PYGNA
YIKYLCRGESRVFTITINELRAEGGGRYWCGVKRPKLLPDLYTEIRLLTDISMFMLKDELISYCLFLFLR